MRGKSALFRFVVRNGFGHFVRKVFAGRKLLPGKFWVFLPLVEDRVPLVVGTLNYVINPKYGNFGVFYPKKGDNSPWLIRNQKAMSKRKNYIPKYLQGIPLRQNMQNQIWQIFNAKLVIC